MKRVGFNLINMLPGLTGGTEIYAIELINAIEQEYSDQLELFVFANRDMASALEGKLDSRVEVISTPTSKKDRIQRLVYEQIGLPRLLKKMKIYVLHSVTNTGPIFARVPHVVTIHDVNWIEQPGALNFLGTIYFKMLVPALVRAAKKIITDSNYSKDLIVKHLPAKPDKITVIYPGIGFEPDPNPTDEKLLREKFALGDRDVLLYVSAVRPYKNQVSLIQAFAKSKARDSCMLVLPGPAESEHIETLMIEARAAGVENLVKAPGWVSSQDLEALYGVALGFIFPSKVEGFGLPVAEAMARGLPVACSNVASLPEVAGDAAYLFDPNEVGQIADAVDYITSGKGESLWKAGKKRAELFSWQRAARQTVDVLVQASGSKR